MGSNKILAYNIGCFNSNKKGCCCYRTESLTVEAASKLNLNPMAARIIGCYFKKPKDFGSKAVHCCCNFAANLYSIMLVNSLPHVIGE